MYVYLKAEFGLSSNLSTIQAIVTTADGNKASFTVNHSLAYDEGVQCVRVNKPSGGIVLVHIPAAPPWQAPLALYVRESDLTIVDVVDAS
jgi:hypothetical protein